MVRENREGGILSSSDMSPNLSLDEVRSLSRGTATTDDLRAQRANR